MDHTATNLTVRYRRASRSDAGGFTLVEMLIVIGLVALLASLTMAVSRRFSEQSEIRSTKVTLRLLDAAVREWEMTTERKVLWWDPRDDEEYRDRVEMHGDVPDVFLITELLDVIGKPRASRDILAQISPGYMHTYRAGEVPNWVSYEDQFSYGSFVNKLTVLDAWDHPVYATHPGRNWRPEDLADFDAADEDGTVRTSNENRYGIAPHRQIVFISAGPDGRFGIPAEFSSLHGEALAKSLHEARADNLYSARMKSPVEY